MSTSGSNKRENIVYRRTEKRLFMSRTLRILDTFDTKLKSVIGENAEINDLLGYTETQQKNITSHTEMMMPNFTMMRKNGRKRN